MYTVLVIDDSISMRRIIQDFINELEDFEVIDLASDAYEAREKIKLHEPDLVTIDINMPKMNGVTFLRNLMRLHPMPAVVISGESVRGNDIFDDGAVGFIPKPEASQSIQIFAKNIKNTIMNLEFLLKRYTLTKPKALQKPVLKKANQFVNGVELRVHPDEVLKSEPALLPGQKIIGIGSSTGGIEALLKIFKNLPKDLPPIIISQHIPYGFSNSFAQRLNDNSQVDVKEAEDGDILEKSHAYLAPGNIHLCLKRDNPNANLKINLLDAKKVSRHKPSVDIMLRSLNNAVGGGAMAIMLTGMGDDGSIGIKEIFDSGGFTLAQDKNSCVVFGMPAKAIEIGAIKVVAPLDEIYEYIIDFSQNKHKKHILSKN